MGKYILQRILAALPVLFGILFITFALARLLPGDPCVAILGEKANEVTCSAFNARYGLDKPIVSQFVIYLGMWRAVIWVCRFVLGNRSPSSLPSDCR